MKYRKLTKDGDYPFGNNSLDFYVNNAEAVAQSVKTRLLLFLNEWFLNVEDGTPWVQGVFGKQVNETYENIIRTRILETENVNSIEDFTTELNRETRKLTVSCMLITTFGSTPFTLEV